MFNTAIMPGFNRTFEQVRGVSSNNTFKRLFLFIIGFHHCCGGIIYSK
jgi:hypothetical protein